MRILMALVGLALAQPTYADDACLAAPTRACLFDLAQETALASDNSTELAAGLIALAASQEAAGLPSSGKTLDLLLDHLVTTETKPGAGFIALGDGMIRVQDHFETAPKTALALAEVFAGLGPVTLTPPEDRQLIPASVVRAYALAGQEVEARLWINSPDYKWDSSLDGVAIKALIRVGDDDGAFSLMTGPRYWAPQLVYDGAALEVFLEQGDLKGARVILDNHRRLYPEVDEVWDFYEAYGLLVARAFIEQGSPEAREVADNIKLYARPGRETGGLATDPLYQLLLAEIYALLGDADRATQRLAKADELAGHAALPDDALFADHIRAVMALKAHDVDGALSILTDPTKDFAGKIGLETLAPALVTLTKDELARFLENIRGDQGKIKRGIAEVQIKRGDLAEAAAITKDLLSMGKREDTLARALALAFMKSGAVADAMFWAKTVDEAALYAELAVMID